MKNKPTKSLLKKELKLNKNILLEKYQISSTTLSRWLKEYNLVQKDWGANKLNFKKAQEIRLLYNAGKTQIQLAKLFNVSQGAICKIINNLSYREKENINLIGSAEVSIGYHYASI